MVSLVPDPNSPVIEVGCEQQPDIVVPLLPTTYSANTKGNNFTSGSIWPFSNNGNFSPFGAGVCNATIPSGSTTDGPLIVHRSELYTATALSEYTFGTTSQYFDHGVNQSNSEAIWHKDLIFFNYQDFQDGGDCTQATQVAKAPAGLNTTLQFGSIPFDGPVGSNYPSRITTPQMFTQNSLVASVFGIAQGQMIDAGTGYPRIVRRFGNIFNKSYYPYIDGTYFKNDLGCVILASAPDFNELTDNFLMQGQSGTNTTFVCVINQLNEGMVAIPSFADPDVLAAWNGTTLGSVNHNSSTYGFLLSNINSGNNQNYITKYVKGFQTKGFMLVSKDLSKWANITFYSDNATVNSELANGMNQVALDPLGNFYMIANGGGGVYSSASFDIPWNTTVAPLAQLQPFHFPCFSACSPLGRIG